MGNLAIFKQQNAVAVSGNRELSDLAKSLATSTTSRRIQTNINGTFKRIVNGEQIGNAVRGEINVIIVGALPKVSRIYYKEKFDPNKEATLPNCWSNLGDKPETAAEDKQHSNCADCPQNIKGSGENGSKACRYQRRISVLVEGDPSGDVYQFNVPAKSLFGNGTGNVHPFESYVKFLIANGESPDNVVTNISFDANADTMELLFTPLRNISDEEYELVKQAQQKPETKMYTRITVAQAGGVKKQPPAVEQKAKAQAEDVEPKKTVVRSDEPEDDGAIEEPVKRQVKKAEPAPKAKASLADVVSQWSEDE
jgi:hypothetical protein